MARNADLLFLLPLATVLALAGCADSTAVDGGEDSPADLPDPGPDLPDEPTEWEGILDAVVFGSLPSQFTVCETGDVVQIAFAANPTQPWSGSCRGVYHRFAGTLNQDVDPPLLIVDEVLEARWCGEASCDQQCSPDFSSCYAENDIVGDCDPMTGGAPGCGIDACRPTRFYATQSAGWMHHTCVEAGEGESGDPCSYPEAGTMTGRVDTCSNGHRCWNTEGDMDLPGTCVSYCDPEGLEGPACEGTCVPCSSSGRGLCVSGCSGEDCSVHEFC